MMISNLMDIRESRIFNRTCTPLSKLPSLFEVRAQTEVTEAELNEIRTLVARNPIIGDPMPGTGGARKVRFTAKGKGKSGGYRVITFLSGDNIPVFLLDIYAKGEKINLSQQEKNTLRHVLKRLAGTFKSELDE